MSGELLERAREGLGAWQRGDYPARVGGPGWLQETATVIRFRDGRAVQMQQYRTREEAFRSLA